ncbi:hypothetical protein ACLIYP_21160 [Streptomyces nanhaiensis]|uniref:hypothetical protein n=1 Tax=Streptomyces nanhaiensis TaxID=679319 RepID=UPI00399C4D6D
MPQATMLHCDTEAAELICLRDPAVPDAPLEARIGIAPGLALLVQDGAVAGWSLAAPTRYLTSGYTAPASPRPPRAPGGSWPSARPCSPGTWPTR